MFKSFLGGISIALLIITISNIFLSKIGEVDIQEVVKKQKSPALFLRAYNQNSFEYKFSMYQKINPDIVVLGSSRVLGIRAEFFNFPMYNFGQVIQSIADLENVEKGIQPETKLIILALDPWWFFGAKDGGVLQASNTEIVSFDMLIRSVFIFIGNIFNVNNFHFSNFGLQAIINNEGFAYDGSYHYTKLLRNNNSIRDPNFELTKNFIKNNTSVFSEIKMDYKKIEMACDIIKKIKAKTESILVYSPPFPHPILNLLKYNDRIAEYNLVNRLLESCLGGGINIYDSEFISEVGKNLNCEYIDGLHVGDVYSARIMRAFSFKVGPSLFNNPFIDQFINEYQGSAGGMTRLEGRLKVENDFLNLGCSK